MLLKKAIITGIASLSTVSVVGVSAFNYVKNVKTDEKENCAISLETNSIIYTNLAQALEENADKTEEDFDVKVSNTLPQSQEYTESAISEKNTSESTNKTNNLNDNTSTHNPEVNVAETDNGNQNTNDTSENIPAKTTTENVASSNASTNNGSKNTSQGNTPAIAAANTPVNTDSSNASTISEATAPASTDSSNASANTGSTNNNNYRTVSYYTNDESTLLRVEYYDDNSKLVEYSAVTNYDKDTNSYTETVYQYDYENNVEVTTRTDTYVDGEIVSSETP